MSLCSLSRRLSLSVGNSRSRILSYNSNILNRQILHHRHISCSPNTLQITHSNPPFTFRVTFLRIHHLKFIEISIITPCLIIPIPNRHSLPTHPMEITTTTAPIIIINPTTTPIPNRSPITLNLKIMKIWKIPNMKHVFTMKQETRNLWLKQAGKINHWYLI